MNDSKAVFQRVLGAYARNEIIAADDVVQVISTLIKDCNEGIFIDGLGLPASFELIDIVKKESVYSLTTGTGAVELALDFAQVVWTKKYPVLVLKSRATSKPEAVSSAFCVVENAVATFYTSNFALVLTPIDEDIDLKKSKKGLYSFNLHTLFGTLKTLDLRDDNQIKKLKPLFWEMLFLDVCFHFYSNSQTLIPIMNYHTLLEETAKYRDLPVQAILLQLSSVLEDDLKEKEARSVRELISKYAALVKAELTLDAYI